MQAIQSYHEHKHNRKRKRLEISECDSHNGRVEEGICQEKLKVGDLGVYAKLFVSAPTLRSNVDHIRESPDFMQKEWRNTRSLKTSLPLIEY